jgi:hypothetical protein
MSSEVLFVPTKLHFDTGLREQLADRVSMSDFTAYLRDAQVVASSRMLTDNKFDASQQGIPVLYLTDGRWVWSEEVVEYASKFNMPLPDYFVDHVVEQGTPQEVSPDSLSEIAALIFGGR